MKISLLNPFNLFFFLRSKIGQRLRRLKAERHGVRFGLTPTLGSRLIVSGSQIKIGDLFSCYWDCRMVADRASITIGTDVRFSHHVDISAGPGGHINIGDGTGIAQFTVLRNSSHEYRDPNKRIIDQGHREGNIDIGEDCIISASCVILPDTEIGKGCVVGAGSVLSGKFPEYSIIMGNPARIIGKRK